MGDKSIFDLNDFNKICQLLNTVLKMDIRLIDQDGNKILQIADHYLPSVLKNFDNEYHTINLKLRHNQPNSFYHFVNSYGLEYIASGIWKNHSYYGCIVLGPFISSTSVMGLVSDIIALNHLPVSQRKQLEEFYKSLSVITQTDYKKMGELLVNLCHHPLIETQEINTDIIVSTINKEKLKDSLNESKQIIEARYENEKKLMQAIAKGNKEEVAKLSKLSTDILDFSNRIPESPIRSAKNITLVVNTLCRIAAEKGNLHPVYIDNISEKFAILIERAPNLKQLKNLCEIMMNEYCDTVKVFSTKNYSPMVKKAVDYIHFNLEEPLTLNAIAAELNVNASLLSRKFKEDTNMNIIDYINHKRVDEAKLYLQRGNTTVTEVAFMVGFNDHNYFTRVFKKITKVTPSEYMKGKNSG